MISKEDVNKISNRMWGKGLEIMVEQKKQFEETGNFSLSPEEIGAKALVEATIDYTLEKKRGEGKKNYEKKK